MDDITRGLIPGCGHTPRCTFHFGPCAERHDEWLAARRAQSGGGRQFPEHLNRIRVFDRAAGRSVELHKTDWEQAVSIGLGTVQVSSSDDTEHWYTDISALDFRFFGEPLGATAAVRRMWASRDAYDRRDFWRKSVLPLTDARLVHELRAAELGSFFGRLAVTELNRRQARRVLNPPSAAVRASDARQLVRQRVSAIGRDEYRQWERRALADIAARSCRCPALHGRHDPAEHTTPDQPLRERA